jgi:hypothetical protein
MWASETPSPAPTATRISREARVAPPLWHLLVPVVTRYYYCTQESIALESPPESDDAIDLRRPASLHSTVP